MVKLRWLGTAAHMYLMLQTPIYENSLILLLGHSTWCRITPSFVYTIYYDGAHRRLPAIGLYRNTFPGTYYGEDAEILPTLSSCDLNVGIASEVLL